MLACLISVKGHLDTLQRARLLILSDAFTLPFFAATTIAMLYLALSSAATVAREREAGTLEALFYGPVDEVSYLLAKQLAQLGAYLPIALATGLLLLAYAGMTGFRLGLGLLAELALSVIAAAAVVALGLFLSTIARGARAAFALFALAAVLFLVVRLGSELLGGIAVPNNLSPLLFARELALVLDRLLGLVSPFAQLESGIDAVVRGDALAYLSAVALAALNAVVLLAASVAVLRRRGVRR